MSDLISRAGSTHIGGHLATPWRLRDHLFRTHPPSPLAGAAVRSTYWNFGSELTSIQRRNVGRPATVLRYVPRGSYGSYCMTITTGTYLDRDRAQHRDWNTRGHPVARVRLPCCCCHRGNLISASILSSALHHEAYTCGRDC